MLVAVARFVERGDRHETETVIFANGFEVANNNNDDLFLDVCSYSPRISGHYHL